MVHGYRSEPIGEYENILSNLGGILPEVEDRFHTAQVRMLLTVEAKEQEDLDKLLTPEINWGLDYLRRQELVDIIGGPGIGKRANYNHEWIKKDYSQIKMEEIIKDLEY